MVDKSHKPEIMLYLVIILVLIAAICILVPKHVLRYFYWNFADLEDYKKFPSLVIEKGETPFEFVKTDTKTVWNIPEKFLTDTEKTGFEAFLERHKTVAFLIIRDDTMLYENYCAGRTDSSIIPSFSVAKAFVSALVGIAIDEGCIRDTRAVITNYLPELKNPGFGEITIEDLLNMRSGIDFNEGYNSPFADMAKYYYGTDLKKYISQLKIKEPPGQNYDYISVNALLLSLIVERATGRNIADYLEQKIWKPLGMESDGSWSVDSKKNKTVKSFCCINAVSRDFARFGRLYLNKGNWQGKQIISENWIRRSTSITNDSRDSQGYPYTYFWRVLENGAFFAKGILGQYIIVYPAKKLVFVRMGTNYGDLDWTDFCIELSAQLK